MMMKQNHFSFLALAFLTLLASCHKGVTLHPSRLTTEVKKECAATMAGLYDTKVRVVSTIAGAERVVKIEDGKRTEYFESQDSTLQLKATVLDYDNGMKIILHGFPVSTLAAALPDSLGELRTAIAAQPDQELTLDYLFVYDDLSDQLFLKFSPHQLSFVCQTSDGRQHYMRLSLRNESRTPVGELKDRVFSIDLGAENILFSLSAVTLFEDEKPIFTFEEWVRPDFFYAFVRFEGRS